METHLPTQGKEKGVRRSGTPAIPGTELRGSLGPVSIVLTLVPIPPAKEPGPGPGTPPHGPPRGPCASSAVKCRGQALASWVSEGSAASSDWLRYEALFSQIPQVTFR